MSFAARAGPWGFAAGILATLLALLVLTVGSPDGRSHQDLPLPPGGMTLEPGGAIEIPPDARRKASTTGGPTSGSGAPRTGRVS
jgi:hypothetical protein